MPISDMQIDHGIPIWFGGAHHPDNWVGLKSDHHRAKTKLDVKAIAKTKRLIRKADSSQRKPSRMKSRGFQTKLTRGFDGLVRPR